MTKTVYLIHGWDGTPSSNWFPWLKKELLTEQFNVIAPQLPIPELPRINRWIPALTQTVKNIDENTYFIGHSMGCQAIIRYLETLPENTTIGGAIFVAGFLLPITNLEPVPEIIEVDREWNQTPINFTKVKTHLPKNIAIFSTNDKYVSLNNAEQFQTKLGSEIIIIPNAGHFNIHDGFTEFPQLKESILTISK